MSLRDDINIPLITVLGVVSGLLVAVAIVGTQAGYNYVNHAQLERNFDDAEKSGLLFYAKGARETQRANLYSSTVAWNLTPPPEGQPPTKEFVHIGIERAMDMMVESKGAAGQR